MSRQQFLRLAHGGRLERWRLGCRREPDHRPSQPPSSQSACSRDRSAGSRQHGKAAAGTRGKAAVTGLLQRGTAQAHTESVEFSRRGSTATSILRTIECHLGWHAWEPLVVDVASAHHQCLDCGKVKKVGQSRRCTTAPTSVRERPTRRALGHDCGGDRKVWR